MRDPYSKTAAVMASAQRRGSICFLATALHPLGGAERQVGELATAVHKRGWDVSVVSMVNAEGEVAQALAARGIPIRYLGMRRGVPDPRGVVRFARWLRARRPEIVHSHMVHANLLSRVTSLLCGGPVFISTVHNMIEGGRFLELGYRITDGLAHMTTAICEAAAERYARIGAVNRGRLRVLPNGIRLERFGPDIETRNQMRAELGIGAAFCWLAAGRLTSAKGYECLLAAFAKLRPANALLLIAGEGELESQLRQLAEQLGVSHRVQFLGFRSDIVRLHQAADAFVLASRYEGLPLAVLEAAASGLPVVATDVGGNREIIEHGRSGFLVPCGDPDLLAAAMKRCMELDLIERQQMVAAARRHVSANYSLDAVVSRWEQIYTQLIWQQGGQFPTI